MLRKETDRQRDEALASWRFAVLRHAVIAPHAKEPEPVPPPPPILQDLLDPAE